MKTVKAFAALLTVLTLNTGFASYAQTPSFTESVTETHEQEKVTDIMKIYAMLKEYAYFNMLSDVHDIYIRKYDGSDKVFVEVYDVFSDSENSLRMYIAQQRIDEDMVEFLWLYRHTDEEKTVLGDANFDGRVTVRDCAYIASCLSRGKTAMLPDCADYNGDGKINVRDAAAISKDLANK